MQERHHDHDHDREHPRAAHDPASPDPQSRRETAAEREIPVDPDQIAEMQATGAIGGHVSERERRKRSDPDLAARDPDAASEPTSAGDEQVGGTAPTPDQDRVDDIGRAVGVSYRDEEPLRTETKLDERDARRWELDPRSTDPPRPGPGGTAESRDARRRRGDAGDGPEGDGDRD
jgi:hypothetical protein